MPGDVFVGIPWRDRGDKARRQSVECVHAHLQKITHAIPHRIDGDGEAFSLAAARNRIVRMAEEAGAKVVVICDSDTLIEQTAMSKAVVAARESDRVILPFNLFRALGQRESIMVMNGRNPILLPDIGSLTWSVGGAFVTTPEAWWALGGQDERFTGWGCEDTAFNIVADKMRRSHVRVEGVIHHLWHPASPDKDAANLSYQENAALLQRYVDATDITTIIKEHHRADGSD